MRSLLGKDMQFAHIKVVYPTAPLQPYTPNGGEVNETASTTHSFAYTNPAQFPNQQPSHVWFDRQAINPTCAESKDSLAAIYASVSTLIDAEVAAGIPLQRIAVGGFSMGGALALHCAFHLRPELRACFALSSFLGSESSVYDTLSAQQSSGRPAADAASLLMMHGDRDSLVRPQWGRQTFDTLRKFGVAGVWQTLPGASHELQLQELRDVMRWLEEVLPAEPTNKL